MHRDKADGIHAATTAVRHRPDCIASAGFRVRVRRDKGIVLGFRNEACSNFGSLAGVRGATLVEPAIAECGLTLRRAEVATQEILAVSGSERLLELADELLGRGVRGVRRLATPAASKRES